MTASTHLVAGAAAGVLGYRFILKSNSIYGLIGALTVGIVSHLLLDMIPHADEYIYRPGGSKAWLPLILSVEMALSFILIYLCGMDGPNLDYQNRYLLAGMIGGALLDIPHVLMDILKVDWKFLQAADKINSFFHTSLHPGSLWQGIVPQIIILALSLTVLYFFKLAMIKATP